ncbi:hypothetical protein NHX12_004036 [Muraenolepis orangiensis]|uniref:Coiled-coil domain-containing protein 24 n=1 Tax=Muraenolepis orangiensis TaxID=630683 RepID=A0A9Q0IDF0_9TELE|nr:hypothetical protein NHX12_004036 [Muraenolepis orangiensis]
MEVKRGTPRQSLWRLIQEHVPQSELPEVSAALGQSLVDMYAEVHSEVDMWLGIWREVKQGGHRSIRPETPRCPLADPPVVKELLRGEVRMLLQDGEEVWSRYDPVTVTYALGGSTDCVPGRRHHEQQGDSPAALSLDLVAGVGDELEAVRDQLNVVGSNTGLSERQVNNTEPTVSELREQRRVIQMDLDLPSALLPRRPSSSSSSTPSSPPTAKRLQNTPRSSAGLRAPQLLGAGAPDPRLRPPPLRLHPLPSVSHVKPGPPPGPPPARRPSGSSRSARPLQGSSLARTGGLQPLGLLPGPSEGALRPAASGPQRGPRKQTAPSTRSLGQRDEAKGERERDVSSVSDNGNPRTPRDPRQSSTDPHVLSMTRRDISNGCVYSTMNHHLVSATSDVSHTQRDDDVNRSIVGPVRASSAVFLTASFQPLPPTVPKLTTGERHLVRRLSVRQDYNVLRGRKDTLHTVNTGM